MERRGESRIVGALKEAAIQTAIALGKPKLTVSLSRRFGRGTKEQLDNWREAHIVAARYVSAEAEWEHIKAIDNPPMSLQQSNHQS